MTSKLMKAVNAAHKAECDFIRALQAHRFRRMPPKAQRMFCDMIFGKTKKVIIRRPR